MEMAADERIEFRENLSPAEMEYYLAVIDYVKKCRNLINNGIYELPDMPELSNFEREHEEYIDNVREESNDDKVEYAGSAHGRASEFFQFNDGFFSYYINKKTGERKFELDEEDTLVESDLDDFCY